MLPSDNVGILAIRTRAPSAVINHPQDRASWTCAAAMRMTLVYLDTVCTLYAVGSVICNIIMLLTAVVCITFLDWSDISVIFFTCIYFCFRESLDYTHFAFTLFCLELHHLLQ